MPGFYYLATPYSRHPRGTQIAHQEAVEAAAICFRAAISVYSPIAHSHFIAAFADLAPGYEAWRDLDEAMIAASRGLIVVKMDGWDVSAGIKAEIAFARQLGLPIVYMTPGAAPDVRGAA
ncbi:MAG: DUF1937 family protein [Rhodospirillaceae bacterium]